MHDTQAAACGDSHMHIVLMCGHSFGTAPCAWVGQQWHIWIHAVPPDHILGYLQRFGGSVLPLCWCWMSCVSPAVLRAWAAFPQGTVQPFCSALLVLLGCSKAAMVQSPPSTLHQSGLGLAFGSHLSSKDITKSSPCSGQLCPTGDTRG